MDLEERKITMNKEGLTVEESDNTLILCANGTVNPYEAIVALAGVLRNSDIVYLGLIIKDKGSEIVSDATHLSNLIEFIYNSPKINNKLSIVCARGSQEVVTEQALNDVAKQKVAINLLSDIETSKEWIKAPVSNI